MPCQGYRLLGFGGHVSVDRLLLHKIRAEDSKITYEPTSAERFLDGIGIEVWWIWRKVDQETPFIYSVNERRTLQGRLTPAALTRSTNLALWWIRQLSITMTLCSSGQGFIPGSYLSVSTWKNVKDFHAPPARQYNPETAHCQTILGQYVLLHSHWW